MWRSMFHFCFEFLHIENVLDIFNAFYDCFTFTQTVILKMNFYFNVFCLVFLIRSFSCNGIKVLGSKLQT